ncbi:MAG: hypothetical protein PVSMB4_08470 [Ktedonobacterales bacterium]
MSRLGHLRREYRLGVVLGLGSVLALWLAGCGALVNTPPAVKDTGSTAVTHPYPTVGATAPAYAAPLTAAQPGWASGPTCRFTNQGLVVQPEGGLAYICLAPVQPLPNVAVQVTVQQVSGSLTHAFGIAFRHAAPKNYYFFGIDGHGRFTLNVVVNDISHPVIPFTPQSAIHVGAGASNTLEVLVQGQRVTLRVNGTPVGQATLTTFASGSIGLRGINDGQVRFTQLAISPLG